MTAFRTSAGLLLLLFRCTLSELVCELSLNTILHPSFRHEEIIGCQIHGTGSFQYEVRNLSKELLHRFRSRLLNYEQVWVTIPDEWIDKHSVSVTVPANTTIPTILPSQRRRQLSKTTGTYHVLMLRIVALDAEPDLSAEQLYNLTFVDDASLRAQMGKCSFGKLHIVPTEYGVLDVRINMNATGTRHGLLVEEAYKVAKTLVNEDVDNVQDFVDGVMVVVPPGTLGDWTAFGSFNGKHTSYNNRWAGYLGATMHEIGHNLGLPHAYENGVEYEDETGYMGNAPQQINFPRKCYNGPNHWHLGWYSRTLELNFESDAPSPPTNVKLAAFVDYDMTSDEHYVIIKVGDVYLQYNRATKFNVDTSEMKDMVTITEFSNHKTNLVAGLNSQSRFWQSNDTQVMVEFCRRSDVSFKPNYIEISIGQTETDCGNAPTLQPSTSPTLHPPLLPTSTTLPTLNPSMVPTKYQNTSEAPTFLVETNPAPQRADTNGGKSQGPSKSPVTKISTIDIDPNVSQERDPREQDGPESVITIILTVVLGAFFVMIVLVLRRNRRLRKSKAEERSASEEDEAPKHNNLFVRCITRSESNDDIVHLTKSDSSSAESSPNTSIESFDEERCDNLEDGEVCEISVDEKPAQLPSATGLENVCRVQVVRDQSLVLHSLVKPRSALRVENGFLSHPKNSGHGVLSQDAVG